MLKDFNETLAADLQDPEFVAGYLQAALEDGPEVFLVALRNVVKANGGMTRLSEQASLGRESLYKALSEKGNPEFRTVQAVLSSLGLHFSVACNDVPRVQAA